MEEKIERYEETDFKCEKCGSKLDYVPLNKYSLHILEYVCPNCKQEIYYSINEDQWFLRLRKLIPEPKIWKTKKQI